MDDTAILKAGQKKRGTLDVRRERQRVMQQSLTVRERLRDLERDAP